MSNEHKAALAVGRDESRAVRRYLEAMETHRPKRGRQRTAESLQARLETIEERIASADALTRVHLVQERIDLQNELATKEEPVDLTALEEEFVRAAKGYADRKGISYTAWREAGVSANVLREAGIARTRS